MQVQLNTDNHISGTAKLAGYVENVVTEVLGRFGEKITRVEVHLSDQNSAVKFGEHDKRCVLEARLAGRQPVTVRDDAATLEHALEGAAEKMRTLLSRTLDRLEDPRGRVSMAGDQSGDAADDDLDEDE
ncbi:hypothetical protein Pla175_00770 [Pirellulimonas nuda]|uniref:Sigma 54 modulation protein / S30EA ribosomal protein n=1 Tax=Pirellulimonas nuda TaxID=2528009 RepID=A0A518D5H7_9BACT|nr:HPF/RaiA family ribosome-associated protein [Pirellulimonas nuda]QDU86727.1 hypothetical protein Pla175_00770 [Pirellulimonas nuda]